jgi:dTDP-glucose 4,6-dehydratase
MSAVLVTGAAGFIGSHVVDALRARHPDRDVVSFDALTYAGNLDNLASWRDDARHHFVHGDVADRDAVRAVFEAHDIDAVLHLAAESHVDRSLVDPMAFVRTNVQGTAVLLQEARRAWGERSDVRFVHVSTDEVFGSLGPTGSFDEHTPYDPRSPYSASKAAADHLVRAFGASYGLPVIVTNCSNNYGPRQFPEKLVSLVILRALTRDIVPVYGAGENVRDWLFVEDHARALVDVLDRAAPQTSWCIGGGAETPNLALVHLLLDEVDRQTGRDVGESRALVRFVADRPGHDFRYAIDSKRIRERLGWAPSVDLAEGLRRTVSWMRAHPEWLARVTSGAYRAWESTWYGARR